MRIIFSALTIVLCISCVQQPRATITGYQEPNRNWTFVVYMAADNDLETEAINNFNQLEGVNYANSGVTVLVLIDRSIGHDATNENWTDTRLYEIQTDPNGVDATMHSKRLNVPELGLTEDTNTELDTGDYRVLQNTLKFAKKNYSAKNYALIVWGHGSGWRSRSTTKNRAIGFDDGSSSFITNPELGRALAGMDFSMVAFDTCFGGLLEIAYELRNDVKNIVGSPGLTPSTGWNYESVFTEFIKTSQTIADFEQTAIEQYQNTHGSVPNSAISAIDLSKIEDVKVKLDTFALSLADCITSQAERDIVNPILLNNTANYHYTTYPSELFIDIYDMTEKVNTNIDTITSNHLAKKPALQTAITNLQQSLQQCITKSWKQGVTPSYIMSVHLIPLQGNNLPATEHDDAYIKGSGIAGQSAFVQSSTGWVPNTPVGTSLLDKLFYTIF